MWDCASQLWVPGRSRVHGRPYLSFAPLLCNTLVPDLDEYADGYRIKKEQVGTPFGLVGALEGGFGGLGPSGPKISKHRSLLLSRTNNTSTSCLACTLPFFALTSKP